MDHQQLPRSRPLLSAFPRVASRPMKLFFLVSSLDLTQPFSATPAWWQLMKGLYEIGVEVIAAPYQGPAIESLWWRASPNPAKLQGDLFKWGRDTLRRITRPQPVGATHGSPLQPPIPEGQKVNNETETNTNTPLSRGERGEGLQDRLIRRIAQTTIAPLWLHHLDRVLTREPDIDAVIFLTPPLNHLVGVASEIQRKHSKPVLYYDGDVPASLPSMRGFASGFRIYQGADLTEYVAFISNSAGGAETLKTMGAKAVHTLYYGADPDVFTPVDV